ncbi:MAG: M15 family metallopeptidase [Bacteroidota bacterium]
MDNKHPFSIIGLSLFLGVLIPALALLSCEQQAKASQTEQDSFTSIENDSVVTAPTIPFDTMDIKYLLGTFNPAQDDNFVSMASEHTAGSARNQRIHKEAYAAFKKMYEAAKSDGITLTIRSATRNFTYQKGIWERKWTGERLVGGKNLAKTISDPQERARAILKYSSMPGTSRHHWGSDIDLNSFENSYFESGKGLKEFQWLSEHAEEYGFCRPYTAKGEHRPEGYEEEKWHWSYKPLALKYQENYKALVSLDMIKGFKGAEAGREIDVITHYVFGIDPVCF